MPNSRTPLTITKLEVFSNGVVVPTLTKFTAMLNPTDYRHSRAIEYSPETTLGQTGPETKFSAVGPEKVSFSLVFDGTGAVVPANPGDANKEVATCLSELNKVVYVYDGQKHEPSHVRLLWGTMSLDARLESMSTHYTLFKPSGEPLRAKVELGFVSFVTASLASLLANRSSPDLSHRVLVREGDTLPLLCHRIYGDAAYYPEVARFNRLAEFRRLPPGLQLDFPPLE